MNRALLETRRLRLYVSLWWDEDVREYGFPIQVSLHTSQWFLAVRPFSGFADLYSPVDGRWHDAAELVRNPVWRRVRWKWDRSPEKPKVWRLVTEQYLDHCWCRGCGRPLDECPEGDQADTIRYWKRTRWQVRLTLRRAKQALTR